MRTPFIGSIILNGGPYVIAHDRMISGTRPVIALRLNIARRGGAAGPMVTTSFRPPRLFRVRGLQKYGRSKPA